MQFKDDNELISFVKKAQIPDWQRKLFERNADAIQVHSQGHIFQKIMTLFPNEQEESKEHRVLAFESVTEASFGRAANNVSRIFKNSSYTVDASEKTIELVSSPIYEGQNFFTWFLENWVRWSLKEDANSRIVIFPKEYVDKGNPQCEFIASCHLKYLSDDTVVYVSERESEVKYELKETYIEQHAYHDQTIGAMNLIDIQRNTYTPKVIATVVRPVYHVFSEGKFYRVEQLSKSGEYQVEEYDYSGEGLPVIDAGGDTGKNKVNKSFLHPFVPFGNLALLQHSQHTAVNFTFSFPRMSEIQTPCEDPHCEAGFISCETEADLQQFPSGRKPCLRCGGTGFTKNQTPYKIYAKKFDPQGMAEEQKHLSIPEVQFYTPDTKILEYSKAEWKEYLEMAETAVYIQQRVKTGNVQAAKSKEIDRDDLYSFLTRVGQVYFSRLRFALQWIENSLTKSPARVSVGVPYSYAILDEGDAFNALNGILTSTVPVMMKANQVESFINKFVSQNSPIRKFIDVLKIVDLLLYYSTADITAFKLSGVVNEEQYANHVFAYPVLQRMYSENKNLFLQDTSAIVSALQKELAAFKPAPVQSIKDKFIQQ